MNEIQLRSLAQELSKALKGRLRFNRHGFTHDPFCPFIVQSASNRVRVVIYLGTDGGLAILDRYQSPCPFEFYVFKPQPLLATMDMTSAVKAPFSLYASPAHHDEDCIQKLFSDWREWRPALEPFKLLTKPLMIASEQCQFFFPRSFIPTLFASVLALTVRLSSPPFEVLARGRLTTRYSDRPYVRPRKETVPLRLRPLLPLAARWGISDENELIRFAKEVGPSAVNEFVTRFRANLDEIELFCNRRSGDGSFSDEVVAFQVAFHAFALLESSIETGRSKHGSGSDHR